MSVSVSVGVIVCVRAFVRVRVLAFVRALLSCVEDRSSGSEAGRGRRRCAQPRVQGPEREKPREKEGGVRWFAEAGSQRRRKACGGAGAGVVIVEASERRRQCQSRR